MMSLMEYVSRMECMSETYKQLVGKLEGKKTLGSPRCRWENNVKIHLRKILCQFLYWNELA